jgi:LysM repeat protein
VFVRIVIVLVVAAVVWAVFARDTGASGPARHYTVRSGDTLWSIAAAQYSGDPREAVWKLERRNGLTGTTLVPGERLSLP